MKYRHVVFASVLALLLNACAAPQATTPDAQRASAAADASRLYPVRVTAREVKNRIVECTVRGHVVRVDQPKDFGADDTAPTPPELLAASLGSCVVSTIQFLAAQRGLEVRNIEVTVEGTIDFSKAMGQPTLQRAGFGGLKVAIRFDADMTAKQKAALVKTVFDVGAAIDNIQHGTPVTYEVRGTEQ